MNPHGQKPVCKHESQGFSAMNKAYGKWDRTRGLVGGGVIILKFRKDREDRRGAAAATPP